MTKVHAFKIRELDITSWIISDWMHGFQDDRSYRALGYEENQVVDIDPMFYDLFKPEKDHYCIVWPHGLVTFRPEAAFLRDFTHCSGTVYETPYEALFQRGMMSPEGQARLAEEREAKLAARKKQYQDWEQKRAAEPKVYVSPDGYVVRRVDVGLVPEPAPVQPRFAHVSILPLLRAFVDHKNFPE